MHLSIPTKTRTAGEARDGIKISFDYIYRILVIDRDTPLMSKKFEEECLKGNTTIQPIPTARHDFKYLVENTTRWLKMWLTASNMDAGLSKKFWFLGAPIMIIRGLYNLAAYDTHETMLKKSHSY